MVNGFYIILFEFANSFAVQILHLGEVTQIRTSPQKINNNDTTNVATIGVSLYKGDSYSMDQTGYNLFQNYPNPFNPVTKINYSIKEAGMVALKVYDILGREVKILINEYKEPGNYKMSFNANDFASGIYIYKLQVNDFVSSKKLVLLR